MAETDLNTKNLQNNRRRVFCFIESSAIFTVRTVDGENGYTIHSITKMTKDTFFVWKKQCLYISYTFCTATLYSSLYTVVHILW